MQTREPRMFSLKDAHGRLITNDTFLGEWLIVLFGFTHCPDSRAATLVQLANTSEKLKEQGTQRPRPVHHGRSGTRHAGTPGAIFATVWTAVHRYHRQCTAD